MVRYSCHIAALVGLLSIANPVETRLHACCAVFPVGKPVVNADQTVILIWDAATKTQHFIRKASFKSEADDFGFLIPSPTQPELAESGNDAFPYFQKITEPELKRVRSAGGPFGCGAAFRGATLDAPATVRVLDEKLVAGFNAVVLETNSAAALVTWLRQNGYTYSPEVETWAKPYVQAGWKITALKVAKDQKDKGAKVVAASALRMSFKTDRPLFPYREPDSTASAGQLGAKQRLLRIYFVAEAIYQGELTKEAPWTGNIAWAGKLSAAQRTKALKLLHLPESTGPKEWWLTEFEDNWPYKLAPAEVYFSRSPEQKSIRRDAGNAHTVRSVDITFFALAGFMFAPVLFTRIRRRWLAPG